MKKLLCLFAAALLPFPGIAAQEFGFGAPEAPGPGASGVSIGGRVSAKLQAYADDFGSPGSIGLGDIFEGNLNFSASGQFAEAVVNLRVRPDLSAPAGTDLLSVDEAFVRAFFGPLTVEGGIRKLAWGRADSLGPLDVTNPLDYSDLSLMTELRDIKIARPMIRLAFNFGGFTRFEGVFVPWFQGAKFETAAGERWTPALAAALPGKMRAAAISHLANTVPPSLSGYLQSILGNLPSDLSLAMPGTTTLDHAEAGLRFTTTLGPVDVGAQYFFGLLDRPAITLDGIENFWDDLTWNGSSPVPGKPIVPVITYNRYHQIGADCAWVLAGFNIRAEIAVNITSDLSGDDGAVYNPALLWSLGFDRALFAGIELNLQANEKIILLHERIRDNRAIDTEAGSGITSTRITARLSRKFFREALLLKAAVLWGIEDRDCYIIPAAVWTWGDLSLECAGGIFAGSRDGELGQYRDNSFVRTVLSWAF